MFWHFLNGGNFFQNFVPFEAFAFNMINPSCQHAQGNKILIVCLRKEHLKLHRL
jgi:hypothetical protein